MYLSLTPLSLTPRPPPTTSFCRPAAASLGSHELRTPLNTAVSGIEILRADFEASVRRMKEEEGYTDEDPGADMSPELEDEWERLETVMDVGKSCSTAVDILNGAFFFSTVPSVLYIHLLSHVPTAVGGPPPPPNPQIC